MHPSIVPRARLTIPLLLSALFLMGSPIALGAQAASLTSANAAAGNPDIVLSPSAGGEGGRIAVRGSGFVPNGAITLAVDGSLVSTSCTADASGSFSSCAFPVPPETSGTHTVTASDGNVNSASAIYSASTFAGYTNPAPPPSYTSSGQATNTGNPTVSVSPGDGKVGATRSVSGSGFQHDQNITLSFDGSPVATSCRTKGDGSFRYCTFTVPAAGPGTHTVTASDYYANSASGRFVLNPGITLTPSRGPVGSGAAVSGSGFAPNSRIGVTVGDHHVSTDCKANVVGSFSNCAFTVPDVDAGAQIVMAKEYSGNAGILRFYHSAMASYTVIPGISLDPAAGRVGRTVTVSGGNYKANRILRVSFDGSRRATSGNCTTHDSGNLPKEDKCTFTVPTEAAGSYNVSVTDGTYSQTATYTVEPNVGLSSKEGAVGSNVAVSGSGYSTLRSVFLDFGDTRVATIAAGASGSFAGTFAVPAATAGTHKVTATDDNGFSDSTSYEVIPAVDLPSGQGPVGGQDTVEGTGFKAKEAVKVTFGDQSVSTDCKTDANGSLAPCAFTVPAATEGTHKVTVSDGEHSAWGTYTVIPSVSLNPTPGDPTAGTVGSVVMLRGSNYAPNSSISVKFNGASVKTSGTCIADAKGNLPATNNCAFTVPAVTAGSYKVTVSDGTYSGSATYTVNAALTLTPNDGPVGSGAMASGSGFAPDAPVTLAFDGSKVTTSCTTDGNGNFTNCPLTIPNASTGYHKVTATDGSANYALLINPYSDSASNTDYAWAGYTVEPEVSPSLTAGPVGSTIGLNGSNYKAGSTISATWDGTALKTSGTCTADAKGNLPATNNCAFMVPTATAGSHTVAVSDGSYYGTYTFTVTPAMDLTPKSGPVNSTATVDGQGYAPLSPVAFTFDGSSVNLTAPDGTSCTTDATGSFSNCAFPVPAKIVGPHPVTASDGTNSGAATFTISPSLILTPDEGPVGSKSTMTGYGFAAYAPITVTIGGTQVNDPMTCVANASGKVSGCTLTVPAMTAGSHTVTATDGTNPSTATYRVDPAITVALVPDAAGSSVKVIGNGFAEGGVDVTIDGANVGSCKADSTGKLSSCTVPVTPAMTTAGSHNVAATDKKGNFATAPYTV